MSVRSLSETDFEAVNRVGQMFMKAPLDGGSWDEALTQMAALTNSLSGQLLIFGGTDEGPETQERDWRIAACGSADLQDLPEGFRTILIRDDKVVLGLVALRSDGCGRTAERDRAVFRLLSEYALSAARLQMTIESEAVAATVGALQATHSAAFLCDARGRLCGQTAEADELLRDNVLQIRNAQLAAPHTLDSAGFQSAMEALLQEGNSGPAAGIASLCLALHGPSSDYRWCELFLLPNHGPGFGFAPRIMVVIHGNHEWAPQATDIVMNSLGLTHAESDISVALALGWAREDIAVRRHVSLSTVNAQIKAIFSKTNVNREAALVALIHRLLH